MCANAIVFNTLQSINMKYTLKLFFILSIIKVLSGEIFIDFNGNVKIHNAPHGEVVRGTPPKFVDGTSLLIGPQNRLWVPSCGKLRSDEGTVELTISASDWKLDNSQYLFYARQDKGNDVIMIRGRNGSKLAFFIGKLPSNFNIIEANIDWAPERRHVIKATWNRDAIALFIDGRQVGKVARSYNNLQWADPIWLGGVIWPPGDSQTALDHFRLSDQSDFSENPALFNLSEAPRQIIPLENNIAKDDFGVALIPGSQFKADKSKSVEMTTDGILNTFFLSEKNAPPDNHYIEVIWPASVIVNSIRVTPHPKYAPISGSLSKKNVDGSWQQITNLDKFGQIVTFQPMETERLHFDFTPGPLGQLGIAELEVGGQAIRHFLPMPKWGGYFLWPNNPKSQITFFRREFDVADVAALTMAHFQLSVDDAWDLYVNGRKLGVGGFAVKVFDLLPYLQNGSNTISIRAENFSGPAGLLAELTIAEKNKPLRKICTDNQWQHASQPNDRWFMPGDETCVWLPAERSPSLATYSDNMPFIVPDGKNATVLNVTSTEGIDSNVTPADTISGTLHIQTRNKLDADYGLRIILGEEALSQNCDYTLSSVDVMPEIPTSQWQPHQTVKLHFKLPIPSWAPHGKQPLRVMALSKSGALSVGFDKPVLIMVKRKNAPPPVGNVPPECKVELINNQMRPIVNGKVMPPLIFALNSGFTTYTQLGSESEIPCALCRFSPAQCSLYVPEGMDADAFFAEQSKAVDQQIRQVLRFHPQAKLLIPLNCRINYARNNPSEAVTLSNGQKLMYSFSSDQYLRETIAGGERIIRHILQSDYAGAIAGFIIVSGAGGESMFWGYNSNRGNVPREKLVLGDFSEPAQRKFRAFLRMRYNNNLQKLQTAWKDTKVTFDNARPNIDELRRQDHLNFRNPATGCMAMDYWDFHSDSVAESVVQIAKAFKNASNGKSLIGCWGFYSFSVYPSFGLTLPGGLHHIGAMSLDKILESHDVDFLACIQAYAGVRGNTMLNTTMPQATIKQHRKLFIEEFDVRTFFVDLNKVADHHTTSEFETVNVMKRDFGETLSHGHAAWFCGFSSGYTGRSARGWYSPDVLVNLISQMNDIGHAMNDEKVESVSEVALFTNNRDIAAMDVMDAAGILNNTQKNSVYGRFRGPVACEGIKSACVPYDIYLLGDFSKDVVQRYKFIVMLNCFYLSEEQRIMIREVCEKQKKHVLWLYASGYVEKNKACTAENISKITGINITESLESRTDLQIMVDAPKFTEHKIALSPNPYTGGLINVGPVFSVADQLAECIGRYAHNDQVALASKNVNGMQSTYCALPLVTRELFIDLCRRAGVHVFSNAAMAVSANSRIIAVQAPVGCKTAVKLPQPKTVLDLYSQRIVGHDIDSFELELKPRETALLYQGNDADVQNMLRKLNRNTMQDYRRQTTPSRSFSEND